MTPCSSANFETRFSPAMQFCLPYVVGHPGAVAGEGDDVGHLGLRGAHDALLHLGFERSWRLGPIPAVRDAARARGDGRDQAVLADDRPIRGSTRSTPLSPSSAA